MLSNVFLATTCPPHMSLDPKTALEHLSSYNDSDGLAVEDLMNAKLHGGLTYNDFLLLPGRIDFPASGVITESGITSKVVFKGPRHVQPCVCRSRCKPEEACHLHLYPYFEGEGKTTRHRLPRCA